MQQPEAFGKTGRSTIASGLISSVTVQPFVNRFLYAPAIFFLWLAADLAVGAALDAREQSITLVLSSEPPQMDSTRATDLVSGMVLGHTMEGLMRYDAQNRLQVGVAESYRLTEKGVHFYLKRRARWSDGKPVTAHDFIFAWRKALDPANASQYAFILYSIKNAEAVHQGKLPVDALGAYALGDYELRIEYRGVEPHFLKLLAFQTYLPVREDFYNAQQGRYGADTDKLLYNGPFTITEWVHGARLTIEKNDHYWDKDSIRLNKIDWAYFTSDQNATLNLFRDGLIASSGLGEDAFETALSQGWRMKSFADGSVSYLGLNFRPGRPTRNADLRRALHLAFNPYELINTVIGIPGYQPGLSLFPVWLRGQSLAFRVEHPAPEHRSNYAQARILLARARAALGEIPPLTLLVGDSPLARKNAEYFQNIFQKRLGLTIKIDTQIFKQRLAKMTAGEYDIVGAGWGPDYDDPLTFGDLFTSWNENNRGRYVNPELDRQVRIAEGTLDVARRMAAFAEIQRIVYEDTVIIPIYERGEVYVEHPSLKGVVRRVVGTSPDYSRAWIGQGSMQ